MLMVSSLCNVMIWPSGAVADTGRGEDVGPSGPDGVAEPLGPNGSAALVTAEGSSPDAAGGQGLQGMPDFCC